MPVDDRHEQRRGAITRAGLIDVDAAFDEGARRTGAALAGGKVQRGQPALRADQFVVAIAARDAGDIGARGGRPGRALRAAFLFGGRRQRREIRHRRGLLPVGAARQQQAHHIGTVEAGGHHQRGLAERLFGPIDVGAGFDQARRRFDAAGSGRQHQRRGAGRGREIRIGAGRDQHRHHLRVPGLAGHVQRRQPAKPRGRPNVRAGRQQHLRQRRIAQRGRPVQRRHAVALRGVDVGALLQQRADRGDVARLRPRRRQTLPTALQCDRATSNDIASADPHDFTVLRSSAPVLSPNWLISTPMPCSAVSIAFAIGVPSSARTCRLPLSAPPALPAKNNGQRL